MTAMRIGIFLVAAFLALTGTAWSDEGADCDTQPIIPILDAAAAGTATLCVRPRGITAEMDVTGLGGGNAYTTWWVYFDDPSLCVDGGPGVCGPADFYGDDPLAVLGRMDSAVVRPNGEASFRDRVSGMEPASGSLIQLFVFGHGPVDEVDGRHRARQLLTPEDPTLGPPHLGIVGGPLGYPAAIVLFVVP